MRCVLVMIAAAVVVATNVGTLIVARQNRSDPSGGTLELTEREARLVQFPWESTATFVELRWDVLSDSSRHRGSPVWLDAAKLAELGFDCSVPVDSPNAKEHYRAMPSALVFAVLEYEGEAWRQASDARETKTRLFVVDAGRASHKLRERYADAGKYVITRAVVRLSYEDRNFQDGTLLATPRLQGWIESVLPSQICVPQPFGRHLEGFRRRGPPTPEPAEEGPRFAVRISWGSNYEPWVDEVHRLTPEAAER